MSVIDDAERLHRFAGDLRNRENFLDYLVAREAVNLWRVGWRRLALHEYQGAVARAWVAFEMQRRAA